MMATPKERFEAKAAKVQELLAKYPDTTFSQLMERLSLTRHQLYRICKRYGVKIPKQQTRGWEY